MAGERHGRGMLCVNPPLMSSGSKKKESRYTCLSEAEAAHSQRMWAKVSFSAPYLLHSGLSDSPISWRFLLRVLCPMRRPVRALDYVLLKDRNLALAPRRGPEISSRACIWVSPRPRHQTQCCLTNQLCDFTARLALWGVVVLVTTTWRLLRWRMEVTVSRCWK
jgi:hypothetical protein